MGKDKPLVYTKYRKDGIRVSRKVVDKNGNELLYESFYFDYLVDAISALREMYELDKMMFDTIKPRSNTCLSTAESCSDKGYCYKIQIYDDDVRTVICGIDDPKKYAREVFCLPSKGDTVTQQ